LKKSFKCTKVYKNAIKHNTISREATLTELLTTQEVAVLLKMSPVTISRKASKGEIPAVKIGRRFRFNRTHIEEWLGQKSQIGKTIMVVDDEEIIRIMVKSVIEKMGYNAVVAGSGMEALELLPWAKPKLIFLDLRMPSMDGKEVFRRIRAGGNYVPIVIITGYPQSDLLEDVLAQGPLSVVKKPFTVSEIYQVIESFLGVRNIVVT
jgi:excisionase family DNA binding protein